MSPTATVLTHLLFFTDNKILMLPEESRLLFFAHALAALTLRLGFLARTPWALLASFMALTFDTILDCPDADPHQFVHFQENEAILLN